MATDPANPGNDFGVKAAVVWVMAWCMGFLGIGVNHLLTSEPDTLSLFLVAGSLAAFLGTLWFVSVQPHSSVALASNLIMLGTMFLASVVVSRHPTLMALRWTTGRHNPMLVASSVWVPVIWLSIICAGGVAEVHHVFQSRAR